MIKQKFRGSRSPTSYFRKLPILVFTALVILLAAIYLLFVVKNDGNHELNVQFVGYADRIAENFNDRMHANLLALDSFSISSTSYALNTENSWPMITVPDFAIRSWTTRQEMKAETLGLLPIVTTDKRQEWENYAMDNQNWIEEAREWENEKGKSSSPSSRLLLGDISTNRKTMISNRSLRRQANFTNGISSNIYTVNMEGAAVVDEGMGPFSPIWMTSPAPKDSRMINFNMLSHHLFWQAIEDCMYSRLSVLSRVLNFESSDNSENIAASPAQIMEEPISSILYPVFDNFEENSNLVAVLAAEIYWRNLLENSLPDSATEVVCVVETACDQKFSFKIDGHKIVFLGPGDYHDPKFSNMVQTRGPNALLEKAEGFTGTPLDLGHCPFLLHVYPASAMKENYASFGIIPLASCLLAVLIFAILIFFYFENLSVGIEENDIENLKVQKNLKVHSVPRQPLRGGIIEVVPKLWKKGKARIGTAPQHLKDVIRTMPEGITLLKSTQNVIVTNATLMVAGICSLEKWGEEKEPEETTHLLETVQRSLTVIAKRHGISQVEMIDRNFLAIVGSDDSDVDHAAILVRFACECRKRISELFKSMSAKELSIRFGIHSGNMKPDIKCIGEGGNRFQLFGDTVETTYQMLENGKANRIHVSVDTAELLNLAGKSDWVSPRSDLVAVKEFGNMSTFWVKPKACLSTVKTNTIPIDQKNDLISDGTNCKDSCSLNDISEKEFQSLVDQNTAILLRYLRAIYAKRLTSKQKRLKNIVSSWDGDIEIGSSFIEEARETIPAADFDFKVSMNQVDPSLIEISHEVQFQLRVYVASIGTAYRRENPFHNFQHASYTVLSIDQMIRKITSSSNILQTGFDGAPLSKGEIARELYARSFSIDSDPIIQFAMIFSALIHDVDHMGVSNEQLIKNGSPLASLYKKRCISEQNSLDISWWLLMKADFDDLRSAIYSDTSEKRRFRQVLVNSVIATDDLDSKMEQHRDNNWNKVFVEKVKSKRRNYMDADEKRNLQMTSIIERVMQVADSSYRGQSYRTYTKWNERLFEEALKAYHAGSSEVNPALNWYKSELNYFDNLLMPSLSRLTDTGVFGGSGELYLTQASDNRNAWKSGGEAMVQDMVDRFSRRVVAAQEDTIRFS
jgi:class 3 adenylate cyclase